MAIDIYKVFAFLSGFNAKYKKPSKKGTAQETDTVYLAWVTYQTLLLYLQFQSIYQLIGVKAWKSSECLRRKIWMHFVFFPSLAWPWLGLTFNVGHIQLNYKNPGQFDIFSSNVMQGSGNTQPGHSMAQTTLYVSMYCCSLRLLNVWCLVSITLRLSNVTL